jgi:NAD(P)-dependent dehydrogenase (short-subunit alcohol dehydrogenase family)
VATRRTDVSDGAEVDALAAATLDRFGRIDVVCNNAGVVGHWAPMWELTEADWKWTVQVNLWGVIHGIRAFVPHLVAQNSGHVVNTASMGGLTALPGNAPYNATKHAVLGMTETLRVELDLLKIDVGTTALCPGTVKTALGTAARNRPAELAAPEPTRAFHPGRGLGEPMDPAVLAADAIRAIESDQQYVLTHPGSSTRALARISRLLADFDAGELAAWSPPTGR